MAQYTVLMSCGHEDTVYLFGKGSERERKIKGFEAYGLCKACYKKKMEEKAKAEGLVFNATPLPNIDQDNGDMLADIWFSGNTKPYKDDIKSLGYWWGERTSVYDINKMERPELCWGKTVSIKNLNAEIEKAISIGATSVVKDKSRYAMTSYYTALDNHKKWVGKNNRIASIPKPNVPDVLKNCKWNQKIYGKSGNYSIYPNGEKVMITNEQAKEIEDYLKEKEEYSKKVAEIKSTK